MIRGETIKHSSYKKRSNVQEVNLEKEIKQLEEQVQNNLNNIPLEEMLLLVDKKNQ